MKTKALAILFALFLLTLPVRAQFNKLYDFGSGTDGSEPRFSEIVIDGSVFYGMTCNGGGLDRGTIFKCNLDGSGYIVLHTFMGGSVDGSFPEGSLVISGTTLYGMTCNGGESDLGTIFKIETDGSGFSLLHSFSDAIADGNNPKGSLIISGTTLFGMTEAGGGSSMGTIFKIGIDGS
ncbi:MAG: hypothetical protein PHX05_01840, partial [Acidobacteriota bacterium]|nr:hypothetical protein [Acidobacteriota bacterium]